MSGRWRLALLASLALAGCATLVPKLEAPSVTVLAVAVGPVSQDQQQLRLTLHAVNPNARTIAVRGIDCTLELSGAQVAQGMTTQAFALPANGAIDFDVDVTADLATAVRILAGNLSHHAVDYRLYGRVHLQGGILSTLPFDQRGRVRL